MNEPESRPGPLRVRGGPGPSLSRYVLRVRQLARRGEDDHDCPGTEARGGGPAGQGPGTNESSWPGPGSESPVITCNRTGLSLPVRPSGTAPARPTGRQGVEQTRRSHCGTQAGRIFKVIEVAVRVLKRPRLVTR